MGYTEIVSTLPVRQREPLQPVLREEEPTGYQEPERGPNSLLKQTGHSVTDVTKPPPASPPQHRYLAAGAQLCDKFNADRKWRSRPAPAHELLLTLQCYPKSPCSPGPHLLNRNNKHLEDKSKF